MASLDKESLLKEISPESPCGENLEDDFQFMAIQEKAKGVPERQIGDRIEPAQPPNWKDLRKELLDLMKKTRDLRLLMELVRANLSLEGFMGFEDSLDLLKRSLFDYWECVHPQADSEDEDEPYLGRVNILMGLCDPDSILRGVRGATLVDSRTFGRFSLRDVYMAAGRYPPSESEAEPPTLSAVRAAFHEVGPEVLKQTVEAMEHCSDCAEVMEKFLTERIGVGKAPSFQPLRETLKEVLHEIKEHMPQSASTDDGVAAIPGSIADLQSLRFGMEGSANIAIGPVGAINTRQDVIRVLDLICDYYGKHEPSSPVPLLARRARKLVNMDFMEIMQDLAPEGLNQIHVIKGPEPEE